MSESELRRILVIAGSDSSGGAGLEADQKVIAAHQCYAMTATTALTAQNTLGVNAIHETPSEFVAQQIDACISDIGVDVVKTGMLANAKTIEVVAEAIFEHAISTIIVDPVMVATSGAKLLPESAVTTLCQRLLPNTTILTPNLPEAELILKTCGTPCPHPKTVDDVVSIAQAIKALGPKWVLLKGGHLPLTKDRLVPSDAAERHVVLNVLHGEGETRFFESPYIESDNTHGTGCSLASAIACNLAHGMSILSAVRKASKYVEAGIRYSQNIGKGSGPINHFHSTYQLPFSPGGFIDYLLERRDVQGPWRQYTHHAFVHQMGDGTLPEPQFKNYLIQDYLFLIQFSRANALAAYKSKRNEDIKRSAQIVAHIQEEMNLHLDYCKEWGLDPETLVQHEEQMACTAYTRYVLDIGQSEDWLALQIALLPCLLGYSTIASRLYSSQTTKREGNRYWKWIENYVEESYTEAVRLGCELIEKQASRQSTQRVEELSKIFIHATKMEIGFWGLGDA